MHNDEDLDFEISLYEDLLKDKPNLAAALIPLADAYTKKGLYEKGLQADLRLVALRPDDDIVHYNLACDYSLLQNADTSLRHLERSIELGYDDFEYMNEDPDLAFTRKDKRYKEMVLKHLTKAIRK